MKQGQLNMYILYAKDKWHLEDMHIVLGTVDTVSGQ